MKIVLLIFAILGYIAPERHFKKDYNTDNNNSSIIRNSCYTGYKFRESIPSFVHGNTITASKDLKKNNFNFKDGNLHFGVNATFILHTRKNKLKNQLDSSN